MRCAFYDFGIFKLLVELVGDLNETDNEGNSLLLLIAKWLNQDSLIHFEFNYLEIVLDAMKNLVNKGAYIFTRNCERKMAKDYLADSVILKSSEKASRILEMLKSKSKLQSLETLAAMRLREHDCCVEIPGALKRFVYLH